MAEQPTPKALKFSFDNLLEKFPEVELPVTLTDETLQEFSRANDLLPTPMVMHFLETEESEAPGEFTEYVPCFRIPQTHDVSALVYWKAELMNYEYVLITFSKKGELIDKRVIAGTKLNEELLVRSVATIDVDWVIYVVGGVADKDGNNFDPSSSQSLQFELLADGKIVSLLTATDDDE
ncbi:MAG: hypothetical protein AAFO94_15065 [Bacteroidota bacterium]